MYECTHLYDRAVHDRDTCLCGWSALFSVIPSCLPVYHSVWFVGSPSRLSPHSLLVFHLICPKTLPDQLSSKSNLGASYKIFQATKKEKDSSCKIYILQNFLLHARTYIHTYTVILIFLHCILH